MPPIVFGIPVPDLFCELGILLFKVVFEFVDIDDSRDRNPVFFKYKALLVRVHTLHDWPGLIRALVIAI